MSMGEWVEACGVDDIEEADVRLWCKKNQTHNRQYTISDLFQKFIPHMVGENIFAPEPNYVIDRPLPATANPYKYGP